MRACEFQSTIDNGIIRLPAQYRDTFTSEVKIIVLYDDHQVAPPEPRKKFTAMKAKTKGFHFDREEANER